MKKSLAATQNEFESSSGHTPEYLTWHRLFRREFTKFLKEHNATEIAISSPNHFDLSGFFTVNGQAWYVSIGDLRGFKEQMLIRTARSYKDYTGGSNQYIPLTKGEDRFSLGFRQIVNKVAPQSTGNLVADINETTRTIAQL